MDPTEPEVHSKPSTSHSLLDSLYEFEELQENMDIPPASIITNIITTKRPRFTAKTVPDYNIMSLDRSDLVCAICGEGDFEPLDLMEHWTEIQNL